jgi:hypothetical protein
MFAPDKRGGTMKPTLIEAPLGLDREATCEEIRAALIPFPNPDEEYSAENIREVFADSGEHVRIAASEFEAYLLRDELLENHDGWLN